jgi:hypothetical protein
MAKKNNKSNKRSFNLRGDNNWITILNTGNAILGGGMTMVWGASTALTTGTEVALDLAPKKIAKAIHNTAVKGDGLMDTWDSFMSEDSSKALATEAYNLKDKWIGSREKTKSATKALDKAIKAMTDDEAKAFRKMIKMGQAIAPKYTDEKISKMIKKNGLEETIKAIQEEVAKA